MDVVAALLVFVAGFVCGRAVRWFAILAAVVALALFVLGDGGAPVVPLVDAGRDAVEAFYRASELLFLSGLLFGVGGGRR